jgi:hypothetical protein
MSASGSALLLACAQELTRRCLRVGAKWALELHAGMAAALPPGLEAVPPALCAVGAPLAEAEEGAHELARAYIAGKEFARAAHLLDARYASGAAAASPAAYPPRAFFLRCYALYLVRVLVPLGGLPAAQPGLYVVSRLSLSFSLLNLFPPPPSRGASQLLLRRTASAGARLSAPRARPTF